MSADEERACGIEPWPIVIARKSFECIANLIIPDQIVTSGHTGNASQQQIIVEASSPIA